MHCKSLTTLLIFMLSGCVGLTGDESSTLDESVGDDPARALLVVDEIEAFNASLDDRSRQAKYCKMSETPFVFFRGTNHLFWRDFQGDSRFATFGAADTRIWLQGDLHAYNFGSFDDDQGNIVYDLNDFDETAVADYQWDVWRMAASLVLVARENGGFSDREIGDLVEVFAESYLDTVASYRGNDDERGARFTESNTYGRLNDFLREIEQDFSRKQMLQQWTDKTDGERVFDLSDRKLGPADTQTVAAITAQMANYASTTKVDTSSMPGYFAIQDIAERLDAGTGSLGTPRYYVLIEGETLDPDDDRILDVKRQGPPTPYPYLRPEERAIVDGAVANHAERAVLGYRALLASADDHLGWMQLHDGDYSVRERSPFKEAFPAETLDTEPRFEKLAEQWGMILATAHARSDQDYRADLIEYSFEAGVDDLTDGNHDEFRTQAREIALSYADQVMFDQQAFVELLAGPDICQP